MRRRAELLLMLTALPLLTLPTANNASAQVCASLTLNTQARVDAVNPTPQTPPKPTYSRAAPASFPLCRR